MQTTKSSFNPIKPVCCDICLFVFFFNTVSICNQFLSKTRIGHKHFRLSDYTMLDGEDDIQL